MKWITAMLALLLGFVFALVTLAVAVCTAAIAGLGYLITKGCQALDRKATR